MLDKGKPQKDRPFDWGVRVNSVDSGLCKNDLQALLTAKNLPDTVSLPKVETTEHIKWVMLHWNKFIIYNCHLQR